MIAFRDEIARRQRLDLRVHVNEEGLARGMMSPFVDETIGASGSGDRHDQAASIEKKKFEGYF